MRKDNYNKISLESLLKMDDTISESPIFGISRNPVLMGESLFNLVYPQISEPVIFIICLDGTSKIKINLLEYELKKDSFIVIQANAVVQLSEKNNDVLINFIFFSLDFLSDTKFHNEIGIILNKLESNPCLSLNHTDSKRLKNLYQMIIEQYKRPTLYRNEIIKNYFDIINYEVLRLFNTDERSLPDVGNKRGKAIYLDFLHLLFAHYKTERTVQFYADKIFISVKHLSKVIKDISGRTPTEWITEMVITAAKALIRGSSMSIAQISEELKFPNPSFFGTYFKKCTGLTPFEYRNL